MRKDINREIGKRLREIRSQKGWSLQTLAEQTNVSKPMLGQIERGESNPTVGTLWKIADGLGVAFTSFIEESAEAASVIRGAEVQALESGDSRFKVKPVFLKEKKAPIEAYLVEMDPHCDYQSRAHQKGVEEYIFVQAGSICIEVEEEVHELHPLDSIRFTADQPHRYRSSGGEKAVFTMIILYK